MQSEINQNESEIDLNECESFLKANLDPSEWNGPFQFEATICKSHAKIP